MFIGHYAVGFAAKKWAPKVSLGTLFLAALWLDLIWPIFVLMGLEHFEITPGITKWSPFNFTDYPLSHSLVMACAWSSLLALLYFIFRKDAKGAWVIAALVASHWLLDLVVHRPDLPLLPGGGLTDRKLGLGLWNSLPATLIVEGGLFLAGLWIYMKSTKALDRTGKISLWAFIVFLIAAYAADFISAPPTDPKMVAVIAQAQFALVAWGYFINDHRKNV